MGTKKVGALPSRLKRAATILQKTRFILQGIFILARAAWEKYGVSPITATPDKGQPSGFSAA